MDRRDEPERYDDVVVVVVRLEPRLPSGRSRTEVCRYDLAALSLFVPCLVEAWDTPGTRLLGQRMEGFEEMPSCNHSFVTLRIDFG